MNDHQASATFDRLHGTYQGLPNVRFTRPTTVQESLPMLGNVQTHVIQSMRDEAGGIIIFLQIMRGDDATRIVLPNRVCQAIYRQRDALRDRTTPASRARKARARTRAKARAAKEARKAGRGE